MTDKPSHAVESFPLTQWSLVNRAGAKPGETKQLALTELLPRYLPALQAHLLFRRRLDRAAAEDVLQGFLADKIIEQDILATCAQEKGRFRTFLLVTLDRFLINQLRHAKAAKRSAPGQVTLEPEIPVADPGPDPGRSVEVAWVRQLLDETVGRMRAECEASGRGDVWGVFEARVLEPAVGHSEPVAYGELVERFKFASPTQASNVLITANRMFARLLRVVIGEYEREPAEIEQEIAELLRILAGARGGKV